MRVPFLGLVLAAGLSVPQLAMAQDRDYRPFAEDDEYVSMIDVASIKAKGDIKDVRVFVVFDPARVEDGAYFGELIEQANCKTRKVRMVKATEYDKKAEFLREVQLNGDWNTPAEASNGGQILKLACTPGLAEALEPKVADPFGYGRDHFAKAGKTDL